MKTTSHKIKDDLYLIEQEVSKLTAKMPPPLPTHHIVVIDCSGSMWNDLPRLREQLKAKLPKLLGQEDSVSLIWFSGRDQFGTLVEAEAVASLTDLQAINKAIDRWLAPIGLTGFLQPIEEAIRVIERLAGKYPGHVSLFFMSDGHDNQWPRDSILKVTSHLANMCAAATFVEYGYYADRALLAAMAEKAGGNLIFAEDFSRYEPVFDESMRKRPAGVKKVSIRVLGQPLCGFVFGRVKEEGGSGPDLVTFAVEGENYAHVRQDLESIYYLSTFSAGERGTSIEDESRTEAAHKAGISQPLSAAYAALSLFAVRMRPDIVYPLLRAVGDVALVEQFSGCFGKQKYSEFMEVARICSYLPTSRFSKGWNPEAVADDNAFTLFDLLKILEADATASLLTDHSTFKYKRISRARIADGPKFTPHPVADGYPISSLTFNEQRPNISLLVQKKGAVDLTDALASAPARFSGGIPAIFPTYIWRNYAVVQDGIVNLDRLPIKASNETVQKLKNGRVDFVASSEDKEILVVNLRSLPVLNRATVAATSAADLFELEWALVQLRCAQKVYNNFSKELFPKTSRGYGLVYGDEAAKWLGERGLTDYNGFSPKAQSAEVRDYYMGKEMDVKLAGFASLPSVADVRKRMGAGKKLTGCAALMAPVIKEVDEYLKDNPKNTVREGYVTGMQKATTAKVRGLLYKKSQIVFSVVVGQVWFREWSTMSENTMTFTTPLGKVAGTVEMNEVQIDI